MDKPWSKMDRRRKPTVILDVASALGHLLTDGSQCMVLQDEVQALSLSGIAHRCARETELFFRRQPYDPRYCFELFRRAIAGRDQRAWQLLFTQYKSLAIGWARRHAAFASCSEQAEHYVDLAFEKMWNALTPERLGQFPDLKSLLRYLQMCVHSAILDEVRRRQPAIAAIDSDAAEAHAQRQQAAVPDQALDQIDRARFWRMVEDRLKDEKEHAVIYGSFVLGLKPRELCEQYGGLFSSVSEVYRTKENVLARMRRDADLCRFLGCMPEKQPALRLAE